MNMQLIDSFWRRVSSGLSRTTLTSSIPLAFVVVIGGLLSFRSHAVLRQDRDMVVHTYQVIGAVRQTLLIAEEAETAEQGFVITSDAAALRPYQKARDQLLPATLADLERLLIKNKGQQIRLARLRTLLQEKFSEIQRIIDVRRSQSLETARSLIASQAGGRKTDEIRALVSEMDSVEEGLLKERGVHVATSEKRILILGVFTVLVSLAIRLFMAIRAVKG
jgi:CHASE3 domain sensor protein